jgi:hypothetical protein
MGFVGRVIASALAVLALSMAGAAVAALNRKRQIVSKDAPDADEVHLAAIFEPIAYESTATAFRGGQVDLWFGGGIIDLRSATLDPSGARLEIRAVFGGCQLIVPADWEVTIGVMGIGGGGDGRAKLDYPLGAPHLTIEGTMFLGGFGIASEIPAEAMRSIRDAVAKRRGAGRPAVPDMEPEREVTTQA